MPRKWIRNDISKVACKLANAWISDKLINQTNNQSTSQIINWFTHGLFKQMQNPSRKVYILLIEKPLAHMTNETSKPNILTWRTDHSPEIPLMNSGVNPWIDGGMLSSVPRPTFTHAFTSAKLRDTAGIFPNCLQMLNNSGFPRSCSISESFPNYPKQQVARKMCEVPRLSNSAMRNYEDQLVKRRSFLRIISILYYAGKTHSCN